MPRSSLRPDAVSIEVFQHLFAGIAEEMGAKLRKCAFSPNIKERRDFSCAIFDARGRQLAQAAHIPVHLGSTPASVHAALEAVPRWQRGDAVLLNDPFFGGTHLPDLTLVSPVFCTRGAQKPDFFVVNRAHHADIGGAEAGSMAPAQEIFAEGLRIPPIRWVRAGAIDEDTTALILLNCRTPQERRADLLAQWAANRLGAERLEELWREYGAPVVRAHAEALREHGRRSVAQVIAALPEGLVRFEDALDDDGFGQAPGPMLRVAIERRGERLRVDFSASDPQMRGGLNANRAITLSAVLYVLRLLAPRDAPTNDAALDLIDVITVKGTIVDALPPAAVAGGNVETSQRLVDVLLGALAQLVPGRIPAASAGTMCNLSFGGRRADGSTFTYYETLPGGMGARPAAPGLDAVQTHMTNTRNTPIEALELELPVRVERLAVRRESGGAGAHRGGDGLVKHLRFLVPVRAGLMAERFLRAPYGLAGGAPGQSGSARLARAAGGRERLSSKWSRSLAAGDLLEIETPGGGGLGAP
ncbi:MAG: hydantoinase B/oxoprolinase family protein [Planctomycetes bacterium]|nr:hydantoinase B/oxoprolinase family protein [Planctomycetota bacterium]